MRIFSGVPDCRYTIRSNFTDFEEIKLDGLSLGFDKLINIENKSTTIKYSIENEANEACPLFPSGIYTFHQAKAYSIFLQDKIVDNSTLVYEEAMEKPTKGNPLVRNLANIGEGAHIIWKLPKTDSKESDKLATDRELMELRPITYDVYIDDIKVYETKLSHGGVYALVMAVSANGTNVSKIYEVIEPNSMSILWLVPQYVVMTLGEVMFSVTGLEFSYSQAPTAMKSVLQACWLLTVAFGNVIVVIVAELKLFKSQASEFFLFAGLMAVDMIIFMWVAHCYKPNNPISESQEALINEPASSVVVSQGQQNPAFVQDYQSTSSQAASQLQQRYTARKVD